MLRYFGTDGVRGGAGTELTCELAFRLARAAGRAFRPRRALLAQDTRLSGPALASACAAGLAEAGCAVDLAGVLPSPAISHLVPRCGYDLGVVVSASHNPPQDNGVKLFGPTGLKLSPEEEERVESFLDAPGAGDVLGTVRPWPGAEEEYEGVLREAVGDLSLRGVRLVLDCAHGATAYLAPRLFRELGAEVTVLGAEPDGARINASGAAAIAPLSREVPARGAELGVGFDGDGDRALFVDARGTVVEGDRLIAALAPCLLAWGELSSPRVVFTVLANLGAEVYLAERGFEVERVPVGDRNVAWAMRERGIDLGTLVAPVALCRQVRVDVPVADRERALADPTVQAAIQEAQARLDGQGPRRAGPSQQGTSQRGPRWGVEGPGGCLSEARAVSLGGM